MNERDLAHEILLVKVYFKHNGYDIIQENVTVFLDEVDQWFWEAEVKDELPFEPSCLSSDIRAVMEERKITGVLHSQIDYKVSEHKLQTA